MKRESDILKEIERLEAWLRGTMPADTTPSLAPLKLSVRVAAHETWLAQAAPAVEPSGGLDLDSVKQAVRREVALRRSSGTPNARRRWRVWAGGWAAAAAVLFIVVVYRQAGSHRDDAAISSAAACLDDLQDALSEGGSRWEWEELEADLSSVEESLADGAWDSWHDEEFDDLGGELDSLMEAMGQGS